MSDKLILITGCSSGIGLEAAVDLAAHGYRVIATMRNLAKQDRLLKAAKARGVTLDVRALDVTSRDSIAAAAEYVHATHGPLFALINNAGFGFGGFFEDLTDAEWREQFETNFWGVLEVTRAFVTRMRQSGRGYVINVSSESGHVAVPALGPYTSSKFALEGYTEGLWHELRPYGLHAVLVEPGMIKTDIFTTNIRLCPASENPKSFYYGWSRRIFEKTMQQYWRRAAPPDSCNATFRAILSDPRPRLRYLVGADAKLVLFLKWLLPERLFLSLVHGHYA